MPLSTIERCKLSVESGQPFERCCRQAGTVENKQRSQYKLRKVLDYRKTSGCCVIVAHFKLHACDRPQHHLFALNVDSRITNIARSQDIQ